MTSLWDLLNVRNDLVKKSQKLAQELEKVKVEEKPKLEKEIKELEEKTWMASEELTKARAVRASDTPAKFYAYENLLNKKLALQGSFHRKLEAKRTELDALIFPVRMEALDLMDREIKKLLARKEIRHPLPRGHEYLDRIVDFERIDMVTGITYLRVQTNAPAVTEGHNILAKTKRKIIDSLILDDLHKVLDEADEQLNKVDFEPRDYEVAKGSYEFRDPAQTTFEFQSYAPPEKVFKDVDLISDGKALKDLGPGFGRPGRKG